MTNRNSGSLTSKTFASLSKQTLVTISMAVLSLVVFAIMSRLLSKDDFGKYAALTAITTIFAALTEAGMGSALIQHKNPCKEYKDTAFGLALITGVFFSLLLFLFSDPLARLIVDETVILPLRILCISVFFNGLISIVKAEKIRELDFARIGVYTAFAYIVSAVVAIFMAYNGYGVYAVVAEQVLYAFFTFSIFYLVLPEKPKWFNVSIKYAKEIIGYGGWLTASVLFRVVYQQMDKLLMSRWLSVTLLGAYNRPVGFISQISDRLNSIFDTVLFPILSSIQDDKERIVRVYDKIIYLCGLYASILCIYVLFSGNLLIDIFFGEEWRSISIVFYVITFTLLFSIIGRIMDCFIRSLAYVKAGFYMRIAACFVTFGCLYIGKDFGIEGVALSVIVSNIIIILMKLVYINMKLRISVFHTIFVFLNSQKLILLPLVIFLFLGNTMTNNSIETIFSLIVLTIYIVTLFYFFPNLLGEFLKTFVREKFKIRLK